MAKKITGEQPKITSEPEIVDENSTNKQPLDRETSNNLYSTVRMLLLLLFTKVEHDDEKKIEYSISLCKLIADNDDILLGGGYPIDEEFSALLFYYLWTFTLNSNPKLKETAISTMALLAYHGADHLAKILTLQDINLFTSGVDM